MSSRLRPCASASRRHGLHQLRAARGLPAERVRLFFGEVLQLSPEPARARLLRVRPARQQRQPQQHSRNVRMFRSLPMQCTGHAQHGETAKPWCGGAVHIEPRYGPISSGEVCRVITIARIVPQSASGKYRYSMQKPPFWPRLIIQSARAAFQPTQLFGAQTPDLPLWVMSRNFSDARNGRS